MNPGHVWVIARTDLLRRYRALRADTRRFAVTVIAGAFLLLPVGAGAFAAYFIGPALIAGELPVSIPTIRGGVGTALVLLVALVTIRAVQKTAVPDNADGVLTTAAHEEVVLAIVLVEAVSTIGPLLPGVVVIVLAFAAGIGAPLSVVPALIGLLSMAVIAVPAGVALGLAIRNLLARSRVLSRYRTAIAVVLFLAYFAVIITDRTASALGPVVDLLAVTPFGWYGDLLVLGLPLGGDATLAAGALGVTLLGAAGLLVGCNELAALLWYEEPVRTTRGAAEQSGMGVSIGGVPRPMARVAARSWLRARRSPVRLIYVAYPAFLLVAPVSEAIRAGRVPASLPPLIALYGAWATGAAFTLNPIGDEGPVLPVTLTTSVAGRQFVAGCCLAGLVVGLPVTAAATLVAGVIALSTAEALLVTGFAVVLTTGATGLASGIGAYLPRRGTVQVVRGREAVVPSLFAFSIYSVVLSLASAPGLAVQFPVVRRTLADGLAVGPETIVFLGAGATGLAVGVGGAVSFRFAARTFDRYYQE